MAAGALAFRIETIDLEPEALDSSPTSDIY